MKQRRGGKIHHHVQSLSKRNRTTRSGAACPCPGAWQTLPEGILGVVFEHLLATERGNRWVSGLGAPLGAAVFAP
jgi:hypothetical protein